MNSTISYQTLLKNFFIISLCFAVSAFQSGFASTTFEGDFIQGGMVVGKTEPENKLWQDGEVVRVSNEGVFILGFSRDMAADSTLKIQGSDGTVEHRKLKISKREYEIQRIDGLPSNKVSPRSKKDIDHIYRDIAVAKKARKRDDARVDFLKGFQWPVHGRISGVYGSQRILNGKSRRPHFGVDIARPTGTPVTTPTDGIITMAEPNMFFSGGTLIIDHGHRLSSSFLHLSKILVKVGQRVKKGEVVAEIGATGRVTGPHLDWRMNLRKHRIDPQLLVPAMVLDQ